ncbi:MAG: hypothetical protein QF805_21355, partial [Pirellulaceae bacterium]|nr:hypothetical protein [Pirellulaceae bacterium]
MHGSWARYTVFGTAELEQQVRSLVCDVAAIVDRLMKPKDYRSLVLLGGYGRGEGGVEVRGDEAFPHNNLDFLLITRKMNSRRQAACRAEIDSAMAPVREKYGIGIDFSTIGVSKLRRSPSLVMWYDMRYGHRTVLGDAEFVPSLKQFSVDKIPAWNVRDLLVNRGTLFVINDMLMAAQLPPEQVGRPVVKHVMKAIIGYGDALLYHLGRYHWSYGEKQRRMQTSWETSDAFRELYEEAISFRFQPNYESYLERDFATWMDDLRDVLSPVHLHCEENRLKRHGMTWESYLRAALREALWTDARSPRGVAKKAVNLVRGPRCRVSGSWQATLGGRVTGMRGVLPILFPIVAYKLQSTELRSTAALILGAEDDSTSELRR